MGRAGLVLGYRGRELWRGIFAEASEDLFAQVLQVHIDWQKLWGWRGCIARESQPEMQLECL